MSDEKLDIKEEPTITEEVTKKPFYSSLWWIITWSLLLWPIGILMLWKHLDDKTDAEMPRTKLINGKPDEY